MDAAKDPVREMVAEAFPEDEQDDAYDALYEIAKRAIQGLTQETDKAAGELTRAAKE